MDFSAASKTQLKAHSLKVNSHKSKAQKRLSIKGIEIFFPHEPYPNQIIYMEKVIDSLNSRSYAALESPTGTGKTLCLLCASLAWLKSQQDKGTTFSNQKIFYTSRTHSQLKQVFKELKTTCYEPITSILSSRDNLCVNSALKDLTGEKKNLFCQLARKKGMCPYAGGVDHYSERDFMLCDIEELYQIGSSKNFCPFYYQKNKIKECDIVFMPYNYIFDFDIRTAFDLSLKNVIILVDEAHNMPSVCEEGVSCELTEGIIHDCVKDLERLYIELTNPQKVLSQKSALHQINANTLKDDIEILKNLGHYLKNINMTKKTWPLTGITLSPKEMFDFFFEGSKKISSAQMMSFVGKTIEDYTYLSPTNIKNHLKNLDLIIKGIKEDYEKTTCLANYVKVLELVYLCYKDYEANRAINEKELYVNSFTLYINAIEEKAYGTKRQNGLFFYCFNPGFGFKLIQKAVPYMILITSGTLSPISGMESELKCPFPIQLENSHVAGNSQINFSIITKGYNNGVAFKFDKTTRDDLTMITELGMTILELCKITPGGILVFFPSYYYMNDCYSKWVNDSNDLLGKLSLYKTVYKDKQNTRDSQEVIKQFKESNKSNSRKGGLMLSVCRGSSSEGVDFADDFARMVIVIGIPYANLGCDKVQLKKLFLDKYRYSIKLANTLNGAQWYTNDAILSVNQSLGRVIRHKDDYGSMIVIDGRYTEIFSKKLFSGWLTKCGKVYSNNDYIKDLKLFYQTMKAYSLNIQLEKETNDQDRMKLKWTNWQSSVNDMININIDKHQHNHNDRNIRNDYARDNNYDTLLDRKSEKQKEIGYPIALENEDIFALLNQKTERQKEISYLIAHSDEDIDLSNTLPNKKTEQQKGIPYLIEHSGEDIFGNDNNDDEIKKTKKRYIPFNSIKTPSNEKGKLFLNHKAQNARMVINDNSLYTPSNTSSIHKTDYPIFPNYSSDKSMKVNKIQMRLKEFADKPIVRARPPKGIEAFLVPKQRTIDLTKDEDVHDSNKNDTTPIQFVNRKRTDADIKEDDSEFKSEQMIKKLIELKNQSESSFKNLISKFNELDSNDNADISQGTASLPLTNKDKEMNENKKTSKRYECPVCFENNVDNPIMLFSSSKCGHILCDDCWDKSLQNRLECPLCKHKVRLNTLTKLFLI